MFEKLIVFGTDAFFLSINSTSTIVNYLDFQPLPRLSKHTQLQTTDNLQLPTHSQTQPQPPAPAPAPAPALRIQNPTSIL
jgi:hypothetical protein